MSEHVAFFVDRFVSSTGASGDSSLSIAVGRRSLSSKKTPGSTGKQLPRPRSSTSIDVKDERELQRTGSKSFNTSSNSSTSVSKSTPTDATAAGECRICQEEDGIINLEAPCACSGSLKFAHRRCIQRWCNEKGDIICEICCKPYEGGYTVPSSSSSPSSLRNDSFMINISGSWDTGGEDRSHLRESRFFSAPSDNVYVDSDYEEYSRENARTVACFRIVAFVLLILLLLRHILSITSNVGKLDSSAYIMVFSLKAMVLFLPCYIMARALYTLHSSHQEQLLP
ncbi:hypothetical protein KP509_16G007100 [Ceratopteris richardii]|uniref:RING-CH-type domain-containing protein n=1 Tax=Ceratopteris richardii TaxID=49495 RepID=A0A8T2SXX9_CERRI|nr:hypothetical protein KP509_16G007100 [Ceratopteris richardii]